jgi:hypothetical protein
VRDANDDAGCVGLGTSIALHDRVFLIAPWTAPSTSISELEYIVEHKASLAREQEFARRVIITPIQHTRAHFNDQREVGPSLSLTQKRIFCFAHPVQD